LLEGEEGLLGEDVGGNKAFTSVLEGGNEFTELGAEV
jgi:hypothetical protein